MDDLLALAAAGDEEAAEGVFLRFSPAVLRLSIGLLGDLEDAEEVVQDAFVYALRNLKRFDPTKSSFQTWLFTIAISRCRNKRRRKWLPSISLDWLAPQEHSQIGSQRSVEEWLALRGVRRDLWTAVWRLSPALREALVLRFVGGLTYLEIGLAVGCGDKAAESRVRTGLSGLRRQMQGARQEWDEWLAILAEANR